MRLFWSTLLIYVSALSYVIGQDECIVDFEVPIAAMDTTNLQINIAGLINNQLGVNNNLCGVELHFDHGRIENLRIELVSPFGQVVGLVGPGTSNSQLSQLVSWEVNFISCGFAASPDSGISANWHNNNPWQTFTTYTGSYYPSNGCLENFNMGNANGNWTIRIIDLGSFGNGTLEYVRLIFCDETGLDCTPCFSYAGNFGASGVTACANSTDELLITAFMEIPPNLQQDQNLYFLSVENGTITNITLDPNIANLSSGSYQICGLVTTDAALSLIPGSINELEDLVDNGIICGDLSAQCIDIQLFPSSVDNLLEDIICTNDSISFNDITFFEATDTVIYEFSNNTCIGTRIRLQETDIEASIISSGEIDCDGTGSVIINASSSSSSFSNNLNYQWSTVNGNFLIDQGPIVQVDEPGLYLLTLSDGFCEDTISINIESNSVISYELDGQSLGCNGSVAGISFDASVAIDSFEWQGPGLIPPISLNPFVDTEGWYFLTAYASGCIISDSIFIDTNTDFPEISIQTLIGTCATNTAELLISNNVENFNIEIIGTNNFTILDSSVFFEDAGDFSLVYTDLSNNCSTTELFTIEFDTLAPVIPDIASIELPCNEDSLQIGTASNTDWVINWFDENGDFISDQDSIIIFPDMSYSIVVTDVTNGCEFQESIVVSQNQSEYNLQIDGMSITCDFPIANLCANATGINLQYNWSFEGEDIGSIECISASNSGWYVVNVFEFATPDCGVIDSFFVDVSTDVPNIELPLSAYLPCDGTPLLVDASNSDEGTDISINWTSLNGNTIIEENGLQITVDQAGIYELNLINTSNDCSASAQIEVLEDLSYQLVVNNAPCQEGTGTIELLNLVSSTPFEVFLDGNQIAANPFEVPVGNFELLLENDSGCQVSEPITIAFDAEVPISIQDTLYINLGDSVLLSPMVEIPFNQISLLGWNLSESLSCTNCLDTWASPEGNELFIFNIETTDGCSYQIASLVVVVESINLYIPSAFSPNGDFINDEFEIGTNSEFLRVDSWKIYDRWGNLVYSVESTPLNQVIFWDGSYNDEQLNPAVFVYHIVLSNPNSNNGEETISRRGNISLIK